MQIQAAVPEAFSLHAMEYVATMMRLMPQARNNHKTAYDLATGVPHRKPGPIQAVFGCLVYATDKQVLRTDTISNRSLAGVFMGLGHHARLDANCRSIKIFCSSGVLS